MRAGKICHAVLPAVSHSRAISLSPRRHRRCAGCDAPERLAICVAEASQLIPELIVDTISMRIEFDPAKDEANVAKHGISLRLATLLDWETATVRVDDRFDHGETRLIAYVEFEGRLYYVVFVERDGSKRIISLRRANRPEVKQHGRKNEATSADHADPRGGPGDHGGGDVRS